MANSVAMEEPFFVLNDNAYDRILQKLQNGSPYEWTYQGICPHSDPAQCTCPKFMNILRDGNIIRIVNGVQKPVYKYSEWLRNLSADTREEMQLIVNIKVESFAREDYPDYLKRIAANGPWPIKVVVDFGEGPAERILTKNVDTYAEFVELVDEMAHMMD